MGATGAGATVPLGLDEVPWGAPAEKPLLVLPPHRVAGPIQSRSVVHADGRRPLHSQVYRLGGRVVRRTAWLRGGLWRLTAAVAVANLLLGLGILAQDGPDGLIGREPRLAAGSSAQVVVDDLLIRESPGTASTALAVLPDGAELDLTGTPVTAEGRSWWPVRLEQDDATITGYVWSGGIAPDGDGGIFDGLGDLFGRIA